MSNATNKTDQDDWEHVGSQPQPSQQQSASQKTSEVKEHKQTGQSFDSSPMSMIGARNPVAESKVSTPSAEGSSPGVRHTQMASTDPLGSIGAAVAAPKCDTTDTNNVRNPQVHSASEQPQKEKQQPKALAEPSQLALLMSQFPDVVKDRKCVRDLKVIEADADYKCIVRYLQKEIHFSGKHDLQRIAVWMWINDISFLHESLLTVRSDAFEELNLPEHKDLLSLVKTAIEIVTRCKYELELAKKPKRYFTTKTVVLPNPYNYIRKNLKQEIILHYNEIREIEFDSDGNCYYV